MNISYWYEKYTALTSSNQFLGATLAAAVIAAATFFLRKIFVDFGKWLVTHLFLEITLVYDDSLNNKGLYNKFLVWSDQKVIKSFSRNFSLIDKSNPGTPVPYEDSPENSVEFPKTVLVPGFGVHFFVYRKRLFKITRSSNGSDSSVIFKETLTIKALTRDKSIIESLIEEVYPSFSEIENKTVVFRWSKSGSYWNKIRVTARPWESVRLNSEISSKIEKALLNYSTNRTWYLANGLPHKLTILLKGEPGTGKTSLIRAVAARTKKDLYVFNIANMKDEDFQLALENKNPGGILCFEDVDVSKGATSREHSNREDVSLSTLLNSLDGIIPLDDTIVFLTTNHPETLDPALCRPGRIDLNLTLPDLEPDQVSKFVMSAFGKDYTTNKSYKGCDLHSALMENIGNYDSFISRIESLE